MSSHAHDKGFSAVELLVAILVGVVFFISIGQMYSVVINDAAKARNKATASALAYTQARITSNSQMSGACTASSASITLTSSGLPGNVTQSTVVDCPYASFTNYPKTISRTTVTITYGSPQETVKHVLYQY